MSAIDVVEEFEYGDGEEAEATTDLDFGHAISYLKRGKKLARSGWNGNRPVPSFVPPTRDPIIYEGLVYIRLSDGSVAVCDEADFDLVAGNHWSFGNGYAYITDNTVEPRQTIKLHQLLNPTWEMTDHIDGNKLDNRRSNLRQCTSQENNANRSAKAGSTSKYKGVSFDSSRGKWISSIQINRTTKHLGRFDLEVDAAKAYDKAAKEAYGEFAKLNFPEAKMWVRMIDLYSDREFHVHEAPDSVGTWVPFIVMRTPGNTLHPWNASQADALADDWEVVE